MLCCAAPYADLEVPAFFTIAYRSMQGWHLLTVQLFLYLISLLKISFMNKKHLVWKNIYITNIHGVDVFFFCVCVCVCVFVYIYIYIYIYTHTHTILHKREIVDLGIIFHIYIYIYIYIYSEWVYCLFIFIHISFCVCVCVYICQKPGFLSCII